MNEPRLSVSSWSLRRTLGDPAFYGVGADLPLASHGRGALSLLELPRAVADFGITTLEIVHFHLPSREASYLGELRAALNEAGVTLFSLLIDDGDPTHPVHGERDLAWIADWFEVAATLGSERVRVIAGKQPASKETLELSTRRLTALAARAEAQGLRLMTENWFATLASVAAVQQIMDALEGQVGLCLDFGNWQEDKYVRLGHIAPYAESCHAKAAFDHGVIDREDYGACLALTQEAGFKGPYTLIFDSDAPAEWEGLAHERALVQAYL